MDNLQLEKANKHIQRAWITGVISAAITFIFALVGTYNDEFRYKFGLDTWSLLDVALIVGLTYGIYKKNRYCALGMLIYFILSKFLAAASTGQFSGGLMSLLFTYFFFKGTKAAFQIHKHNIDTGEIIKEKRSRDLGFYLGVSAGSLVFLGIVILLVVGVFSPEIEAVPGKQVNKKYLSFVREEGIINDSEEVQYWYSDGFGDFKNGFYLFTNEKVVIYNTNWEEPAIIIPYEQINDIMFEHNPSFMEDSQITIFLNDNTTLFFPVSSENGGDQIYYEKLLETWSSNVKALDPESLDGEIL